MKKNILFVFNVNESQMRKLIEDIGKICSSNFLKFKVEKENIILNFETSAEFIETKKFVDTFMKNVSDFYFLIEHPENMSISLPDAQTEQFLNLNSIVDDEFDSELEELILDEITLKGAELLQDYISSNNFEEDFYEEEDEDIYLKKSLKRTYSLDEILDKINEKGIDSLTTQEKNYLNNLYK